MNYFKRLGRDQNNQNNNYYFDMPELSPVRKVRTAANGNVYFISISKFPLEESEREQVKTLIDRLQNIYLTLVGLPMTGLLGVKGEVLEFEVLEKISLNCFDWRPKLAVALRPDLPPPKMPSRNDVPKLKQGLNFNDIVPTVTYITKSNAVNEAYKELFGCGGSIFYFSMLDSRKFLDKSKEVFGYKITDNSFQLMDCLPVLTRQSLIDATPKQFQALFSFCNFYICESSIDGGIIIISDKSLDKEIASFNNVSVEENVKKSRPVTMLNAG